jgi:hypothetical protein|tara:strand:+ start:239 stop:574 length:336 start_codon:yes stop_codon:yes gene_type:complete
MHYLEILPETSERSCELTVRWFLMEYLCDYGLDISIIHKDLSKEGVLGWCLQIDDSEFEIEIEESLTGDEYTKTLLHELYHVYQHMTGQMQCEICAGFMENLLLDKYSKTN